MLPFLEGPPVPFSGPWVCPITFPLEPCMVWLGSQRAQRTCRALRPSDPAQPGPQAGAPAALTEGLGGHYAFARGCSSTCHGLRRDDSWETQAVLEPEKEQLLRHRERTQPVREQSRAAHVHMSPAVGHSQCQPEGKAQLGVWVDSTPTSAQKPSTPLLPRPVNPLSL